MINQEQFRDSVLPAGRVFCLPEGRYCPVGCIVPMYGDQDPSVGTCKHRSNPCSFLIQTFCASRLLSCIQPPAWASLGPSTCLVVVGS